MPSPLCTINGSSTTNGVNVTSGSLITIQLIDTTGVNAWSISCTNTDQLQSAASITAAMSVNQSTKTATLTMPSQATALQFTSIINNGVDSNGKIQNSYTTTFGAFVLADGYLRYLFTNETTESDETYGWITDFNKVIQNGLSTNNATKIQGNNVAPTVLGAGQDRYSLQWVNADNEAEWKQIVDAGVDSAAAIAGTKISPNFGSQNVQTTGTDTAAAFINSAANPATTGLVRASNNVTVAAARDFANANDVPLMAYTAGDNLNIGNTNLSNTFIRAKNETSLNVGGQIALSVADDGYGIFKPLLQGMIGAIHKTSSAYTFDSGGSADLIVFVDSSGGSVIVTLPAPASGRIAAVIDNKGAAATHTIQINPNGIEKISGSTVKQITTNYGGRLLAADGFNWFIIAEWSS